MWELAAVVITILMVVLIYFWPTVPQITLTVPATMAGGATFISNDPAAVALFNQFDPNSINENVGTDIIAALKANPVWVFNNHWRAFTNITDKTLILSTRSINTVTSIPTNYTVANGVLICTATGIPHMQIIANKLHDSVLVYGAATKNIK